MAYTQNEQYFSVSTPLGEDVLLLRGFHGTEELSGLYRFQLEMESEKADLDFEQIVGKHVTVTVTLTDGSERLLDGIVGRFVQGESDGRFTAYFAEIHPWPWLLTMSADCRIFQQKSVPDILEEVFQDLGFSDFRKALTGTYEPREYCVQYNETAFDFVSRLMEQEGICYFFEHEQGKHTLVLADDLTAFQPCAGGEKLRYGSFGNWIQQNVVSETRREERVIPGKSALDDFNFETPSTDLAASVDSPLARDAAKRRIYEYPGGFAKKDRGEALGKLRMEEREAPQILLRGRSYAPALACGFTFTLEDHYRADFNRGYVVRSVTHTAEEDSYSNEFDAAPDDVAFRPPRATRKPVIPGTQTAVVVGKSGEEIWTDEYGRVKVQFHWDQQGASDEKSSCWIRVAQGWAGKGWGQMFLPRIGQEVLVSFEDGDPDRPLVTGSIYNAEQTVPYPLPAEQTKSTIKSDSSKGHAGYNELRFEDKADEEEVYFQAEKDFNRVVKNNDTLKVGFEKKDAGDQTIDIYNDRTVTLDQGSDTLTIKMGDRTAEIDQGDDSLTIKQGDQTIKLSMGKSSTEAMASIELKVGQSSIKLEPAKITISSTQIAVQGQAKADVQAAMIGLSGSAMVNVSGALVKIN